MHLGLGLVWRCCGFCVALKLWLELCAVECEGRRETHRTGNLVITSYSCGIVWFDVRNHKGRLKFQMFEVATKKIAG